jgi:hypothetical protein
MSLFRSSDLSCPSCGEVLPFHVVFSVNAVRRPDLREAILNGSFQRQTCATCGHAFRLEPEFNYTDVGREQWIAAFPLSKLGEWQRWEDHAREMFDRAYGAQASAPAHSIGVDLNPRITFGWAGLREKLIAADHGLDDATLELCKIAMLRGVDEQPLADETELRLYAVEGDQFVMGWIVASNERVVDMMRVPRSIYDDIEDEPDAWQELRQEISASLLVDMQRLMIVSK